MCFPPICLICLLNKKAKDLHHDYDNIPVEHSKQEHFL